MKLNATQAHIANEIRRHHGTVQAALDRASRVLNHATEHLGAGNPDFNSYANTVTLEMARVTAAVEARTTLIRAAMVSGLSDEFVASILNRPDAYYYSEGAEFVAEVEHADDLQGLRDRLVGDDR